MAKRKAWADGQEDSCTHEFVHSSTPNNTSGENNRKWCKKCNIVYRLRADTEEGTAWLFAGYSKRERK